MTALVLKAKPEEIKTLKPWEQIYLNVYIQHTAAIKEKTETKNRNVH